MKKVVSLPLKVYEKKNLILTPLQLSEDDEDNPDLEPYISALENIRYEGNLNYRRILNIRTPKIITI